MKNLMTLFAVIMFAFGGFSQTAKVQGTAAELKAGLSANHIAFIMPNEVTADKVKSSAAYYTDYFTVGYNADSHTATIQFVTAGNIEVARRVVTRFLLSCGVRNVNFENKDYTIMQFYTEFLK